MESTIKVVVEESAIDGLDHVNNSVYIKYMEKARLDWYSQVDFSPEEMSKYNLGTVVKRIDITFVKEARLNDVLTIKTTPLRLGNTSFTLKQEITNEFDEIITEATVTSVMFDRINRTSAPVRKEIAFHFATLQL